MHTSVCVSVCVSICTNQLFANKMRKYTAIAPVFTRALFDELECFIFYYYYCTRMAQNKYNILVCVAWENTY